MTTHRGDRGEAGVVLLPLVLLAVYGFGLLAIGVWRVSESAGAVTDAARAGARTFVEVPAATSATQAAGAARAAAESSARAGGLDDVKVTIDGDGNRSRCSVVEVTVTGRVPALSVPWVGEIAATSVSATHRQTIDPLRSGLEGEATCLG
ncbi:MAG: hypothetical protein AAGA99_01825 [Actinomycetota bacterium]